PLFRPAAGSRHAPRCQNPILGRRWLHDDVYGPGMERIKLLEPGGSTRAHVVTRRSAPEVLHRSVWTYMLWQQIDIGLSTMSDGLRPPSESVMQQPAASLCGIAAAPLDVRPCQEPG